GRMRISACNHYHSKFARTGDEVAERVTLFQPLAAVMQGDAGRVVGNTATGAEADRIGLCSLEVFKPEAGIELAWVILNQGNLRPAHRFVNPGGSKWSFSGCEAI